MNFLLKIYQAKSGKYNFVTSALTKIFRAFSFLLFLSSFTFSLWANQVSARENTVVRVGWYADLLNCIEGPNGQRSGYVYDYLQRVASSTGWTYEYVDGDWASLFEMIKKGEIDIIGGVSYSYERSKNMDFSILPMGEDRHYLYTFSSISRTLSGVNNKALDGLRIGMLKGSLQETLFEQWKAKHNLQMQTVYVKDVDEAMDAIAKHKVDGFVSTQTPFWDAVGMSPVTSIGSTDVYFALNKKRDDLKEQLDIAMQQMEFDSPFYEAELTKRYLYTSSAVVSATLEESEWLNKHGPIRIGYLAKDYGVSALDLHSGDKSGVLFDYIRIAEKSLSNRKLEFQTAAFNTQAQVMQALKDKKIDMIFHFSQIPYAAEQNGFILSQTVLTHPLFAITSQDVFNETAKNTIAISRDMVLTKEFLRYTYPQWEIKEYPNVDAMVDAVHHNEVSAYIVSSPELWENIHTKNLRNIFLTHPDNVAFAVERENTLLLSVLNKTLKTIEPSMLSSSWSMYSNAQHKPTLLDYIRDNQLMFLLCLVIFLLILEFLRRSKLAEIKTRELNRKLSQAVEQASKADVAKTRFLFNMSHDIRTPMNALWGYSQIIKSKLTDPKLLEYQQKMEQSGKMLLSIINNVLDMARIESCNVELDESLNSIGDIMNNVFEVFEMEMQSKDLKYNLDIKTEHTHVWCDVTKIQEIFVNLLSNAVKYTPAGGTITIRIRELPSKKSGMIRIQSEVIDNGIGMSSNFLQHIFDPFARERNTTDTKISGTGLGLSIVKKLVNIMGGNIKVESELGKGSHFTFILSHRYGQAPVISKEDIKQKAQNNSKILKGKHVLLAEDNDLNAEIALFTLEQMGLIVERVADGAECVKRIEQKDAASYDLILMDIQMPVMDGYEATGIIRSLSDPKKACIPIVAMTANAFKEDADNALKAGMNGHVAKPIDRRLLISTIVPLLS